MANPVISVIIPCFNPTRHIRQCVGSVLFQTMEDLEVIVIDDGSVNQKELAFLDRLAIRDCRLRVVRNRHLGIALTRKVGFLHSKGDYAFFLDSDDFLPVDALERLSQVAVATGADIIVGNHIRVADSYGRIRIKVSNPQYENAGMLIPKEKILKVCYGPLLKSVDDPVRMYVWGRLYKSSCIREALKENEGNLFPPFKMEDYWFNLTLMPYLNSIFLLNDNVYYYRFGGATSCVTTHIRDNGDYFNYRFDQFQKWNFHEGYPRTFAAFAAMLYWRLKHIILSGDFNRDEMISFIEEEISSQKIVGWAKNNMNLIEDLPNHHKLIVTGTAEDIYEWYNGVILSKQFKIHNFLKNCAIVSAKALDFVYELFH